MGGSAASLCSILGKRARCVWFDQICPRHESGRFTAAHDGDRAAIFYHSIVTARFAKTTAPLAPVCASGRYSRWARAIDDGDGANRFGSDSASAGGGRRVGNGGDIAHCSVSSRTAVQFLSTAPDMQCAVWIRVVSSYQMTAGSQLSAHRSRDRKIPRLRLCRDGFSFLFSEPIIRSSSELPR